MDIAFDPLTPDRGDDPATVLLGLGLEGAQPPGMFHESIRLDRDTCRSWSVRPSMGTLVSIAALDASRERAEDAIEQAFAEMARLVVILNRHDSSTPLAHLNAVGVLRDAPPELLEVIARALRYHHVTFGAFDVTVKPLVDLLHATRGNPAPIEQAEAAQLVGADKVRLSGRRISFDRSGMGITLDGIAKGYVVDRMADALARRGIVRFLINAGGDIRASGGQQDGRPWTIGVRDPWGEDAFCDVVSLRDGALATSGNYERAVAHIVDTGRGRSARMSASVSVSAPHAMAADALATAVFVLGPERGCGLARSLHGCECFIVDHAGTRARSAGWSSAKRRGR